MICPYCGQEMEEGCLGTREGYGLFFAARPEELPSDEEYLIALETLDQANWRADYVITHCASTSIALSMDRHNEADPLTDFLEMVGQRLEYEYWFFGHFHDNRSVDQKHILLWEQIVQIL